MSSIIADQSLAVGRRSQSTQERAEAQAERSVPEGKELQPQMPFSHVVTGNEVSTGQCAGLNVPKPVHVGLLNQGWLAGGRDVEGCQSR